MNWFLFWLWGLALALVILAGTVMYMIRHEPIPNNQLHITMQAFRESLDSLGRTITDQLKIPQHH